MELEIGPGPEPGSYVVHVLRSVGGGEPTQTITLDLGDVAPSVSGPDTLGRAVSVQAIAREGIRIDKAYLVSCANGRLADLEAAARVLRGRKVAAHVELYVAAASAAVQRDAEASGAWAALLDAGAIPLPSGCGAVMWWASAVHPTPRISA